MSGEPESDAPWAAPRLPWYRNRTVATVVAGVALIVLLGVMMTMGVPYTLFYPGPTINVLGREQGKPIVVVHGHRVYRDTGQLRLVTIIPTASQERVTLAEALQAWFSPDDGIYPHDSVYPAGQTNQGAQQQSAAEMASSQDDAVAAALRALGEKVPPVITVGSVVKGSPAQGRLKVGDILRSIDGRTVRGANELVKLIADRPVGTPLRIVLTRAGTRHSVTVRTEKSTLKGRTSMVGIGLQLGFDFPVHVALRLGQDIGGPSAGLMFALSIYDLLTPGSLTKNHVVAGTGEITAAGRVGIIGGIQQKLVGAQAAGTQLFFVPAGNCAEALGANYDPAKMRLVRVTTLRGAIADLKRWTANPNAPLPRCTP